jgi:hypothetical protein
MLFACALNMNASNETFSKDYTECYLAFLDILGFKNIALAHSHEHLKSVYQRFCEAIEHGLSNGKYVLSDAGETKYIGPDVRQTAVNSLLVSDSILIWTDNNSAESFSNIVKAVRSLLAFSIIDGIPLRGAISIGSFTSVLNQWPSQTHNFQHSLFGKAIIEAAEAEKKQEWCGCEITESAISFYRNKCSDGESLIKNKLIVPYPVPRKNENTETPGYVIDWVNHPQAGIDTQSVVSAFNPPKHPDPIEWEKFVKNEWKNVEIKLKNTIKFVEHVKTSENQLFAPWH